MLLINGIQYQVEPHRKGFRLAYQKEGNKKKYGVTFPVLEITEEKGTLKMWPLSEMSSTEDFRNFKEIFGVTEAFRAYVEDRIVFWKAQKGPHGFDVAKTLGDLLL